VGSAEQLKQAATALGGYVTAVGFVIVLLFVPLFGAGLAAPLDKLREAGGSTREYSLLERLFGYSLVNGRRYALLLVIVAFIAGELGLLLWGGDVFGRWWDSMAAGFVPVLAAVWAASVLAEQLSRKRWPRSDYGRKLFVLLVLIGVAILSVVPAMVLGMGQDPPPLSAEIASTMMLPSGTMGAFPLTDMGWHSATMHRLSQNLVLPFLTAGWYVLVGLGLCAFRFLLGRRRA
jgi:hypothetical protein